MPRNKDHRVVSSCLGSSLKASIVAFIHYSIEILIGIDIFEFDIHTFKDSSAGWFCGSRGFLSVPNAVTISKHAPPDSLSQHPELPLIMACMLLRGLYCPRRVGHQWY